MQVRLKNISGEKFEYRCKTSHSSFDTQWLSETEIPHEILSDQTPKVYYSTNNSSLIKTHVKIEIC